MTMTAREALEKGTATFYAHDLDGFAEVLADDFGRYLNDVWQF